MPAPVLEEEFFFVSRASKLLGLNLNTKEFLASCVSLNSKLRTDHLIAATECLMPE